MNYYGQKYVSKNVKILFLNLRKKHEKTIMYVNQLKGGRQLLGIPAYNTENTFIQLYYFHVIVQRIKLIKNTFQYHKVMITVNI